MVQDDTYSLYGESHSAAGTVGNCPTSLGVAPLRLHPCPPQRATGTSPHAPPLSLTTTQRPLKCGRETTERWWVSLWDEGEHPHCSRLAVHPAGGVHFIVKRTAVWMGLGLSASKAYPVASLALDPEVRGHHDRAARWGTSAQFTITQ